MTTVSMKNNNTQSDYQNLEVRLEGEDGMLFLSIENADTGDPLFELYTETPEELQEVIDAFEAAAAAAGGGHG